MQIKSMMLVHPSAEDTTKQVMHALLTADMAGDHLGVIESYVLLGYMAIGGKVADVCVEEQKTILQIEAQQLICVGQAVIKYVNSGPKVGSTADLNSSTESIAESLLFEHAAWISKQLPLEASDEWSSKSIWNRWFSGVNREISCYLLAKHAHHRFFMAARTAKHGPIIRHWREHGEAPGVQQISEMLRDAVYPYLMLLELDTPAPFSVLRLAGWRALLSAGYSYATMITAPELRDDFARKALVQAANDLSVPFDKGEPFPQGIDVFPFFFEVEEPSNEEPEQPHGKVEEIAVIICQQISAINALHDEGEGLLFQLDAALLASTRVSTGSSLPPSLSAEEGKAFAALNEAQLHVAFGIFTKLLKHFDYDLPEIPDQIRAFSKIQAETYDGLVGGLQAYIPNNCQVPPGKSKIPYLWQQIAFQSEEDLDEETELHIASKHLFSHGAARLLALIHADLRTFERIGIPVREIEISTLGMLLASFVKPWISTYDVIEYNKDSEEDEVVVQHNMLSGWYGPYAEGCVGLWVVGNEDDHRKKFIEEMNFRASKKGKATTPFSEEKPLVELVPVFHAVF